MSTVPSAGQPGAKSHIAERGTPDSGAPLWPVLPKEVYNPDGLTSDQRLWQYSMKHGKIVED
jgi:hypothetical protein